MLASTAKNRAKRNPCVQLVNSRTLFWDSDFTVRIPWQTIKCLTFPTMDSKNLEMVKQCHWRTAIFLKCVNRKCSQDTHPQLPVPQHPNDSWNSTQRRNFAETNKKINVAKSTLLGMEQSATRTMAPKMDGKVLKLLVTYQISVLQDVAGGSWRSRVEWAGQGIHTVGWKRIWIWIRIWV